MVQLRESLYPNENLQISFLLGLLSHAYLWNRLISFCFQQSKQLYRISEFNWPILFITGYFLNQLYDHQLPVGFNQQNRSSSIEHINKIEPH